jgi:hypothetical protein
VGPVLTPENVAFFLVVRPAWRREEVRLGLRERVSWTVRKAELEPEEVSLFSAVNRYE